MGLNKRAKFDSLISLSRLRSIQVFTTLLFLYLIFVSFEIPMVLRAGLGLESSEAESTVPLIPHSIMKAENDNEVSNSRPKEIENVVVPAPRRRMGEFRNVSAMDFDDKALNSVGNDEYSELHKVVRDAFVLGKKWMEDLKSGKLQKEVENQTVLNRAEEPCPSSVVLSGEDLEKRGKIMVIPCGLSLGSHITLVGTPRLAQDEKESKKTMLRKGGGGSEEGSQFLMELQGLRAVDGEAPPRILHFNPRLKGDWSGRAVIELNTCYRMQWGTSQRCQGWKSRADEETGEMHRVWNSFSC